MKTQLRLNSIVPHGVGSGSESLALDLIYGFLLSEFGQSFYRWIGINQIGNDLSEFVSKEPGNKIHVNIRYPIQDDFELKNVDQKNAIRLDIIHKALLRVADYDKILEVEKLERIKKRVLDNNFSFYFVCKSYVYRKSPHLLSKIIVHPMIDRFEYYILIEEGHKQKCNIRIYNNRPGLLFSEFFFYGKWNNKNEFAISGKKKEVEIRILVSECSVEFVNLTPYDNPPYFTLMKFGISEEERERARKDWEHSLPPAVAAIIRDAHN
jgi:hypothetical protein